MAPFPVGLNKILGFYNNKIISQMSTAHLANQSALQLAINCLPTARESGGRKVQHPWEVCKELKEVKCCQVQWNLLLIRQRGWDVGFDPICSRCLQ